MKALLLFLLFVVSQVVAGLLAILFSQQSRLGQGVNLESLTVQPIAMGTAMFVVDCLLCVGLALWFYRLEPRWKRLTAPPSEDTIGWKSQRPRPRQIFFAVLAATLLAFGLSLVLEPFHLSDNGMQAQFDAMKYHPLCVLLLVLVGPLTEELIFRAGIVRYLRQRHLPSWLAAAVAALAFAVVHQNWAQAVPAFVIGWIFGLFYLRTGNLSLCLPAHIANNLFALGVMYFPQVFHFMEEWSAGALFALGALHIGLGLLNVRRALRPTSSSPLTPTL